MAGEKRKLKPVLDGEFWTIGDNPDLGSIRGKRGDGKKIHGQECVDHTIFRSEDGAWHLWGCIRGTAVGRILYHWESESLTRPHWKQTGEVIRADRAAGESIDDWSGQEWMQSPFAVKHDGKYWLFYGGHATGRTEGGEKVGSGDRRMDCQICLMISEEGRNWTRHRNSEGFSRVFVGPGETRDPCVTRINGLWHIYYVGHEPGIRSKPGYYVRTSDDLVSWSRCKLAHRDPLRGSGAWETECPLVVERAGYYYLFRVEDYLKAKTHVFRSEDPLDFGIGDAAEKYVGRIAVAAPEIVFGEDGQEYVSSNHDVVGGTALCRLKWVPE